MSDFVTKDSGQRQVFETGMHRDSEQKDLRPDLVYGPMFIRWAELMGRGAKKYGDRNWELARTEAELARFRASAFRHFVQWFYGLNQEEDHAAAVFFNIAGAEFVKAQMAEAPSNEPAKEVEEPWKPTVGAEVLIVGKVQTGLFGKIAKHDPGCGAYPWCVEFADGRFTWFDASELAPRVSIPHPDASNGAL